MDNRQASEPARFYFAEFSTDAIGYVCDIDGSVWCQCDPARAEFIVAALNAADVREKASNEYEERVDRDNDDDREREIMERR